MEKKEVDRILCAAIWYKDQPSARLLPKNIDCGVVVCGHRHPHCIYTINALLGSRQCEQGAFEQGFLTVNNLFVNRKEAAIIAYNSNQIKEPKRQLFSEDLY